MSSGKGGGPKARGKNKATQEARSKKGNERGSASMRHVPPLEEVPEISEELGHEFLTLARKKVGRRLRQAYGSNFDKDLAEDLAQDVALKAINWWRRDPDPLRWNLEARIWFLACDVFKEHLAKVLPLSIVEDNNDKGGELSAGQGGAREIAKRTLDHIGRLSLKEDIKKALLNLSAEERQIIQLHYFDERSLVEIASLLNKTPGAIRVAHLRARKKLQGLLLVNTVAPKTRK